jgi:periplasmic divalent cation tolerance protein
MAATPDFVELVLTCGSWQEAQRITDALLAQHLVACVEQFEIRSKNWWQGKLEDGKEIKLIMKSVAHNFEKVKAEVSKHHSYETFVLQMLPIAQTNDDAAAWLFENTNIDRVE